MPENVLQADLAELQRIAVAHENAADSCVAARAEHPRVAAAAGTWGPMFDEAKQAWTDLVNSREATLTAHERWQRSTVRGVRFSHATLQDMHERNTAQLAGFPQVGGSGNGSLDGRSGGGDSGMGPLPVTNVWGIYGQREPVTHPSGQRP